MKLKMLKGPHLGQKDMICNTSHGTFAVDLGGILEVSDLAGHEILGKWGACFQQVLESTKPVSAKVQVEDSLEKQAEAEASKMMKTYATKKV